MIPPEQLEEIRSTWRLLRVWIADSADQNPGTPGDLWALQLAEKLDALLGVQDDTEPTGGKTVPR
jgi:hypothetical protein